MFKFLKDKLKKAIDKVTKVSEEDVIEETPDAAEIEAAKKEERAERATELPDTEEAVAHREKHKAEKAPKKKAKPKKTPEPKETKPVVEEVKQVEEPVEEVVEEPHVPKQELPEKEVQEEQEEHETVPEPVDQEVKEQEEKQKVVPKEKEELKPSEEKVVEEVEVRDEKEGVVAEEPQAVQESVPEKVEEVVHEESPAEPETPVPEKKSFLKKVFGKKETTKEKAVEEQVAEEPAEVKEQVEEPVQEEKQEAKPEPKGFMGKLSENFTKKRLSEEKFEELFWELELSLLENNVAVEVIEKIKHDMKDDLTTGKVTRKGIQQIIKESLRDSIEDLFVEPFDLVQHVQQSDKRPFIITVIGVNGSGKTTSLAKIANLFQENDLKVVLAASDTFRAAAIDQLKAHADKLSIKLISQGYNADPAAVAFDAIKHAEAQHLDVVLIDTAGRLHSNTNLMAELEKVVRVAKPDLKVFVGESITGNDCVEQADEFNKAVGIDAIILSKADVDEKGGAAISVSYVTGKPILYLGVGQAYGDLRPFDAERIVSSLGL